jgi:hypothetical protein
MRIYDFGFTIYDFLMGVTQAQHTGQAKCRPDIPAENPNGTQVYCKL